jgi:hypothetical protein
VLRVSRLPDHMKVMTDTLTSDTIKKGAACIGPIRFVGLAIHS